MIKNTGFLNLVCESTRNRTSMFVQIPELVIGMWCTCTSNLTVWIMHEFLSCQQIDDCRPSQVHFLCLTISSPWITFLVNFYDNCGNTPIVNVGIPACSSWHKPEHIFPWFLILAYLEIIFFNRSFLSMNTSSQKRIFFTMGKTLTHLIEKYIYNMHTELFS